MNNYSINGVFLCIDIQEANGSILCINKVLFASRTLYNEFINFTQFDIRMKISYEMNELREHVCFLLFILLKNKFIINKFSKQVDNTTNRSSEKDC